MKNVHNMTLMAPYNLVKFFILGYDWDDTSNAICYLYFKAIRECLFF